MMRGGGAREADKLREVEDDIARVELELSLMEPAKIFPEETPLKVDVSTPSQSSTATPQSSTPQRRDALLRHCTPPASKSRWTEQYTSPVRASHFINFSASRGSSDPVSSERCEPGSSVNSEERDARVTDDLSPSLLFMDAAADAATDATASDSVSQPLSRTDDDACIAIEASEQTPGDGHHDNDCSGTCALPEEHDAEQVVFVDCGGSVPGAEVPAEGEAPMQTSEVPASTCSLTRQEFAGHQRDASDAVLIGSARQIQDGSPNRGGRSARRGPANSEPVPAADCQSAAWWRSHPERPAWCWGGSNASGGGQHAAAADDAGRSPSPASSDTPGSPLLPTTSETLYTVAPTIGNLHLSHENGDDLANTAVSASPPEPSQNRSPLGILPPPWAFQCMNSTASASSTAPHEGVLAGGAEAKSACRGKENVSPQSEVAAAVLSGKAHSASPALFVPPPPKPPPKAPPVQTEGTHDVEGIVQDLGSSSSASTPARRLPTTSLGPSAGLFRETPSPRAGVPHKASPIAPVLPRSLLFASPSPHRYSTASEQEVFDWASPIQSCEDPSASSATASQGPTTSDDPEPPDSPSQTTAQLPPPLPTGTLGGDWRPPLGSPCRIAPIGSTPVGGSPAKLASGSPARMVRSGTPAQVIGSPARLGMGNSPARSLTPAKAFLKSPSAPSLGTSPSMRGSSASRSSGDTPRNLTDWRKSLQMARRQDESRPRTTPWR